MKFDPPATEVRVGARGVIYASCSVYGCHSRDGVVIDLGGVEIRLCDPHARSLCSQLRARGLR